MSIWMWPVDGELCLSAQFFENHFWHFQEGTTVMRQDPSEYGWVYIGEFD